MRTQLVFYRPIALATVMASMLAPGLVQAAEANVRHVSLNGQNIDSARSQTLEKVDIEIDAAGNLLIKSDAYRVQAPPTPQAAAAASTPVAAPARVLPQPAAIGPSHAGPPNAAPTDGEPSLKETADWIIGRLNGSIVKYSVKATAKGLIPTTTMATGSKNEAWFQYAYKDVAISDCSLRFTEAYRNDSTFVLNNGIPENKHDEDTRHREFNLRLLDPLSVKVESFDPKPGAGIYEPPGESTRVIVDPETYVLLLQAPLDPNFKQLAGLLFSDREIAKRAATAFKRAITLCGGKVEPY